MRVCMCDGRYYLLNEDGRWWKVISKRGGRKNCCCTNRNNPAARRLMLSGGERIAKVMNEWEMKYDKIIVLSIHSKAIVLKKKKKLHVGYDFFTLSIDMFFTPSIQHPRTMSKCSPLQSPWPCLFKTHGYRRTQHSRVCDHFWYLFLSG